MIVHNVAGSLSGLADAVTPEQLAEMYGVEEPVLRLGHSNNHGASLSNVVA